MAFGKHGQLNGQSFTSQSGLSIAALSQCSVALQLVPATETASPEGYCVVCYTLNHAQNHGNSQL